MTNDEDPEGHSPGLIDQIRQSLNKLDGLKHTAQALEHEAASGIEGEVKEIESQVQDIHDSVKALGVPVQSSKAGPNPTTDSGDESWASDGSYSDSAPAGTDQKKRSKAPRTKSTTVGSGRRGRTRTSLRRGLAQPPMHRNGADTDTSQMITVEERGRVGAPSADPTSTNPPDTSSSGNLLHPVASGSHSLRSRPNTAEGSIRPVSSSSYLRSRPNTAEGSSRPTPSGSLRSRPNTAESSVRHHRLDHIRALHSSPPTREVSPSRSVRFKDELTADSPRSPADGAGDEPDSAKAKVTFDVPKIAGSKT